MVDRQSIINALKSYDANCNETLVNRAMDFAIEYHGSQTRESGDPYFQHPFEVASIITEMRLDTASVITALLHDTIEDTDLKLEEIEEHFGSEVAKLVDGVTKLTKIEFQPDHVRQAENFRKLLLAMSDDIRVLLVKLADRLHNMRTINFVKSHEKRMRIALETMEIYSPLAERIGIQQIKLELQDLAFNILHPEIRESIVSRLQRLADDGEKLVNQIVSEITKTLKASNINAKVSGRQKTPYSIWMKMKQKNVSFEQLSDIIAFRVVVPTLPECYTVLGAVHAAYKMVPESFQDFISTPKNNDYQSLHTVVVGPMKQRIEVQIRTEEMHEIAELGVAAHWRYKQKYQNQDGKQYRWIRELLGILEHSNDSEEFLHHTKLAMYYDQVFCFTPKGSLIALPKGATPIDFAYAVHSDIGHHCVGAKVNGRIVPLRTHLKNGDQVEIVLSKHHVPSPSWEKFVITGKARSEIRRFIRSQQKDQYIALGQVILEKAFKEASIVYNSSTVLEAAHKLQQKNTEELLFAVGEGTISREEVIKQIETRANKFSSTFSFLKFKKSRKNLSEEVNADHAVPIQGLIPGMAVHFAGCCHPLPGDQIIGIIHTGKGVTIHIADCEMLNNFASTPDRIIDLSWDSDSSNVPYICRLKAILINEPGSLAVLTSEIAEGKSNITNLRINTRNTDFFEIIIDVEINGLPHLHSMMESLKTKPGIHSIERYKL
ncbi:MAG: bifunctional (p)ppGpp synthetase/guanosine-3',5'-bis(diphosphate) 3'-pyrophosphohydrolase [Pseudomonadota bacterium]